jgi:hypothetical protein
MIEFKQANGQVFTLNEAVKGFTYEQLEEVFKGKLDVVSLAKQLGIKKAKKKPIKKVEKKSIIED